MKTKRILMALAAMVLVASVMAQGAPPQGGPGGPGGPGGGRMGGRGGGNRMLEMDQKILDGLKLSKDQLAKVKTLKGKIGDKMKAMRAKMGGPGGPGGRPAGGPPAGGPPPGGRPNPNDPAMQKRRAAMQAVRKEYTDGLAKILTKAQMTSYTTQMKAEEAKMRARWGGRGPGGPGGPPAGGPPKP